MNNDQLPTTCPDCGNPLRERKGKYGNFLGCSGYPDCTFTFDLSETSRILCPICDKELKIRKGRSNKFLSCSGYPDCTFRYFLDDDQQEFILSCPDCKEDLTEKVGMGNIHIRCKSCNFRLNMARDDLILCPICFKPLKVRTGRYGRFLGCTGYPDCRFAKNLESSYTGRKRHIYCPKCGSLLILKGNKLECTSSLKCDFSYKLD